MMKIVIDKFIAVIKQNARLKTPLINLLHVFLTVNEFHLELLCFKTILRYGL